VRTGLTERAVSLLQFAARLAVLVPFAAVIACGGGSPTEPPPPPEGPFTRCPADFQVESLGGTPVPVGYALPGASGGTPPLNVACTPASGTSFAVGEHVVTCTVTDAASKTTSCTFKITVTTPPRLTVNEFIGFGDSITLGVKSDALSSLWLVPQQVQPDAYTIRLQRLLRDRYLLQTPVVYNEGYGGEKVDGAPTGEPSGILRLPTALAAHRGADVLLLMEGTNDLLDHELGEARAVEGLRRMIDYAKQRNFRIFLATIPPQRSGGVRHRDAVARLIPDFNQRIRNLGQSEGVPLVDVYDAMKDKLYLIGVDDLHPTPEGHVVIAQTFFDAIRRELEAKPPTQ
jgi:lysophospholipase L1-like esterase